MAEKKNLTLFEASSVVAGLGVGGGIMAAPYFASMSGIVPVVAVMVVCYIVSLLLHLMVAETELRDDEPKQLVEIFAEYLFIRSWWGKALTWIFFSLIVVTFYSLLAAYLVGCGDILHELFKIGPRLGRIIAYIIAAGVVFFGLKAIGLSEKYAVIAIALILVTLTVGSFGRPFNHIPVMATTARRSLALYGMVMFSLACFFSVPQAVEGLSWNRKLVPWAVAIGLGINFVFVMLMSFMAMLVSRRVTEVAIIGWGDAVGGWALVLGSVFAFLAILTSYWSNSYALAVILKERLGLGYRTCWVAATAPTLLLAMPNLGGFKDYLRYSGGAMAVLIAVLIVPAFGISRKRNKGDPSFRMDRWGGKFFQLVVLIAYLVMAAGSIIKVD